MLTFIIVFTSLPCLWLSDGHVALTHNRYNQVDGQTKAKPDQHISFLNFILYIVLLMMYVDSEPCVKVA